MFSPVADAGSPLKNTPVKRTVVSEYWAASEAGGWPGETGAALETARKALDYADRSRFPLEQGAAHRALAQAYAATGIPAEADAAFRESLGILEDTGRGRKWARRVSRVASSSDTVILSRAGHSSSERGPPSRL
jgi:hypothetical protein